MKQQQKKAAKHVGWKTKWYIQYLFFECFVVYGWRKAGKKNTSKSVQLSLKDRCFQPAFPKQSPNIFPRKGLTMKLQWMVSEGTLKTEVLKQRSAKKKGAPKTLSRKNETRQWLDDVGRSFFFGGRTTRFDAHTVCSSCQNLRKRQLRIENIERFSASKGREKNGCLPLKKIPSCETKAETTCKDIAPKTNASTVTPLTKKHMNSTKNCLRHQMAFVI